jgi:hypothetical protein
MAFSSPGEKSIVHVEYYHNSFYNKTLLNVWYDFGLSEVLWIFIINQIASLPAPPTSQRLRDVDGLLLLSSLL